jgi:type VI protein secretion system component VasK
VSRPERPVPPPLEGNDRLITAVITAAWAVALIVLLAIRGQLAPADRWWVWVAAFGTFLGLFGLAYVPYLKRSRERAAERKDLEAPQHPAVRQAVEPEPERIGSQQESQAGQHDGTADN